MSGLKCLWGIRHVRCLWLSWQVHRWAAAWGRCGIGLGHPNPADIEWLRAIWRGEA